MVIKLTLDWIMLKGSFCFQCGKNKQVSWERDWRVARLEFPNLDVKQTLNLCCFICSASIVVYLMCRLY